MERKTKNMLLLLGLLAALAVCLALYFLLPGGEEAAEGENAQGENISGQTEDITVDSLESGSIERLEVKKKGKTEYVLAKKGEEWKLSGQENMPLDESKVTGLFACLQPVKAVKKMERSEEALEEYGLTEPSYTILVSAGGREYQYDLGIEVPVEGGYYGLSSSDGDSIYCMKDSLVSDLFIDTFSLAVRDELPQIEADNLVSVKVEGKKGTEFEARLVDEDERVSIYSEWNILKPFDKPMATSTKDWPSIKGYFTAMTYGNLVQYEAADLGKYGLKNPSSVITVRYYEESGKNKEYQTLTMHIGRKTSGNYYVCEKGSENVYLMNMDVVEKMTELNAYSAIDHCVYATLATDIDGYEAIYGNTKLSVTRTPLSPDGDGGESTEAEKKEQNLWTLNGREIPEDQVKDFLMPYSSAYLLEYSAKADDSVKPKKKEPVLTMIYHEEKRDVRVVYYPYDGTNFYRVDRDGMDYFLVDKRSVDDVIEKFRGIEHFADK